MQYAVSAPWLRSFVLGGIALAATAGLVVARHHHGHKLSLHAYARADALYLSVFRNGPVRVDHEPGTPITFRTWAAVNDGCRWLAIERLLPIDQHRYTYTYEEQLLECDPGAHPDDMTPRRGIVTVDD